jgi:hypothetical protein
VVEAKGERLSFLTFLIDYSCIILLVLISISKSINSWLVHKTLSCLLSSDGDVVASATRWIWVKML